MSADIDVSTRDGAPVVVVRGEVDLANAHQLDEALTEAVAAADGAVTVDLARVDYLDSIGIKVLFQHAVRIELHLLLPSASVVAAAVTISGLGDIAIVHS